MCHNELKSLAQRRAAKIAAAPASVNFGWRGGALNFFFRRRRRGRVPAGGGGRIRRLRGLISGITSLEERRIRVDLIQFFRIVKDFDKVDFGTFFEQDSGGRPGLH